MSKGNFLPELPCERLVRNICGSQWRSLSKPEVDAAWGIAIVKSVLDGTKPEIGELSKHLGVESGFIYEAYRRLNLNGIFKTGKLEMDRKLLERDDLLTWGYYGGFACGATGVLAS